MKKLFALLALIIGTIPVSTAQTPADSAALRALLVGRALPQERVYLHFDNTSYYLGETIWFKAFVTSHGDDAPTVLSRVLYVELMSPEGYIIKTEKYRIDDNGTCHGEIYLNPEYLSGFFEVRAYTRYMLNWGDDAIFSRVFPVYDKVNNGDWEFRNIRDRSQGYFANKVFKKKIVPELRFYPESGHLVNGITSRVAYELTGFEGVDLYEEITVFADDEPLLTTVPEHMGKGEFTFTPRSGVEYMAQVYITNEKGKKKKYEFELQRVEGLGCVISVKETGDSISLDIKSNIISKNDIGFAILHRNELGFYRKLDNDSSSFSISKNDLYEGVNRAVVFQGNRPLAERLFFVAHDTLCKGDKETVRLKVTGNGYMLHNLVAEPHQKVSIVVEREDGKPLDNEAEFALSVTDQKGQQTTSWRYNLYSYLLLGSELKGYIPDAHQYFNPENPKRKEHLELLMLTNGWTAYDWSELTTESFDGIYPPEDGITLRGEFVFAVRNLKPGAMGRYVMTRQPYIPVRLDYTAKDSVIKTHAFRTDSVGKFLIVLDDFNGKQTVALSPSTYVRHGRNISYAFFMDRYFSPEPRHFSFWQKNIGSSIRETGDTAKSGISKIGVNSYMFDKLEVTTKHKRRYTDTSPISELRLDYLDEWEYAKDVTFRYNREQYSSHFDDTSEEFVSASEPESMVGGSSLEPARKHRPNLPPAAVLSVADVMYSIYKRYNLGWQNWVQPVVIKGEYSSDTLPVVYEKYTHGIDVEAMTNFREVILTSNPKNLETVQGGCAIWDFRAMVLPNKHPYERFYEGFLTQLGIAYNIENKSRVYSSDNLFDIELASENIAEVSVCDMDHPNSIAYLIPENRDNRMFISNDLSYSTSTRRYTSVQGYSVPKRFYSPDYSTLLPDGKDLRRTLLWNPSVKAIDGKLSVELYNSSLCNTIAVDVAGYHNNTVYSSSADFVTREGDGVSESRRVRPERVDYRNKDSLFMAQCDHVFEIAEIYYNKKNYNRALTSYIELSQYNYPAAFYRIGEFYLKGINLKVRYDLAAQSFERGAELGFPGCYYELSQMYRKGLHCDASRENEINYIEIAAELHEPRAMLRFGKYLLEGDAVEKDTLRAMEMLRDCAVEFSNAGAKYEYALLMYAAGVEKDSVLGTPLQCIMSAADDGDADALFYMAEYEDRAGNHEQAYKYAKKLHVLDDIRGTMFVADCYLNGRGVKRNRRLAKDLYHDAADAGNEEAKRILKGL